MRCGVGLWNHIRTVGMSKIVDIARKEIGVTENPVNSNKTKYGKWFGWDGVPWCGMFVSWVYDRAGVVLPKIGFSKPGFAGCQTAVAYWTKAKKLTDKPQAGDIVFFDFNGDGRYDHTGIYVREINATTFESIEGNTSMANQANGGTVMLRTRKRKNALFVRP
jgi:cell wall-associated NlpC family hydrolase